MAKNKKMIENKNRRNVCLVRHAAKKGTQSDVVCDWGANHSSMSRALPNAGVERVIMQACILSLLEETAVQRRSACEGTEVRHEWIISS